MTLDNFFKEDKYYLYHKGNRFYIFRTYLNIYNTIMADDIFIKSVDVGDECVKGWRPRNIFSYDDLEYIKEINVNDYPEYFL